MSRHRLTGAPAALRRSRRTLLEVFLTANLAFLGVDVLLAHSVNAFRDPLEWAPIAFSAVSAPVLAALLLGGRFPDSESSRWIGGAVGAASIACGITGMALHLAAWFFRTWTAESLVYAAPFVAPTAYAGIGFLLLANRSRGVWRLRDGLGWGQWVLLFTAGGFAGNYLLSLLDHEQNGFFRWSEWIPVGAAALAVPALVLVALRPRSSGGLVPVVGWILAAEAGVGILGLILHLQAAFGAPGGLTLDSLLYGAPPFAPLLFADLAVLGGIGLLAFPEALLEERHDAPVPPGA